MKNTNKKSKNLFFSGVLILTFSNLLVKVIGLTLKIPLHGILGDEGMAYYNVAYDIYVWLYMISTAGLPVAVSIMISESRAKGNFKESKKIFRITLILFIIIGLLGMGVMFGFAHQFAGAYKIENSYLCIMMVAPTLFFICIASAFRGYFQGYQNMFPTAISEIIEALGKLVIGILFATYAVKQGYDLYVVAAYSIAGVSIGAAGGMIFLAISKLLFRESKYNAEYMLQSSDSMPVRSDRQILKTLIFTAIPIMISSSVMSLTNMIDGMIISRRLQDIGYSESVASAMFGNYKTLAVSMFNLPPALIYPIACSIVPLLSATIASKDKERVNTVMNGSLKIASLLSLPCSLGMSVLAEPILKLLFEDKSAESAAPLLSVLSLSVFFLGMLSISNAILQAHKLEKKPIISMVIGSVVKVATSAVLIGIPAVGMFGAPIGTFLCYLSIILTNFFFLAKHVGFIPDVKNILLRPLAAAVICALVAMLSYRGLVSVLPSSISVIGAICIAALVYVLVIFLIRAVTKDDILLLPKGEKIASLLVRAKLIK